jgi:hypothetical protein
MIRVVHSGSRIRILTIYPSRIPDPRSKGQKDTGSLIRIRNTEKNRYFFQREGALGVERTSFNGPPLRVGVSPQPRDSNLVVVVAAQPSHSHLHPPVS